MNGNGGGSGSRAAVAGVVRAVRAALVLAAAAATGLSTAGPASAQEAGGRSSPAADSVHRRVDRVFREFDRPDSPGCALSVARDGEVAYERGYGMADLERDRPITPATRFYAASVSKQFTAASVLLAEQQGALSVDDPVRRHVPELPHYGDTVRISHLAYHTSGVRDMYGLLRLAGRPVEAVSQQEVVDLLARQERLNFAPGEERLYSNSGYLLMAEIVERATGSDLSSFAAEHLFRPLGMEDTHFHDDVLHLVRRKAIGYEEDEDGEGLERAYLPGFTGVGPGGMWTTVRDLARWNRNFRNPRVGGPDFVERMTSRAVLNDGDTLDYAFGLDVSEHKGLATVGHGGSFMGYRTHFVRAPGSDLAVAVLCNQRRIEPGRLAREVLEVYLEEEIREGLETYAGRYRSPEVEAAWSVAVEGTDLVAKGPDGERTPLDYAGPHTFRMDGAELVFDRGSGRVSGFTYEGDRVRGVRFRKVERSP